MTDHEALLALQERIEETGVTYTFSGEEIDLLWGYDVNVLCSAPTINGARRMVRQALKTCEEHLTKRAKARLTS